MPQRGEVVVKPGVLAPGLKEKRHMPCKGERRLKGRMLKVGTLHVKGEW